MRERKVSPVALGVDGGHEERRGDEQHEGLHGGVGVDKKKLKKRQNCLQFSECFNQLV